MHPLRGNGHVRVQRLGEGDEDLLLAEPVEADEEPVCLGVPRGNLDDALQGL